MSIELNQLISEIERYMSWNEQEREDKIQMLRLLASAEDIFLRENRQYHMTASGWVVNKERTKVLMAYHNIYNSWSWLGGHADGERNLLKVAVGEVMEESGIKNVQPVMRDIFSLEILPVAGHFKKGAYVPSHLHLNVTYLLEADEKEALSAKPDENSGVKWFTPEDAVAASTEYWFREHVYSKLNEKLRKL